MINVKCVVSNVSLFFSFCSKKYLKAQCPPYLTRSDWRRISVSFSCCLDSCTPRSRFRLSAFSNSTLDTINYLEAKCPHPSYQHLELVEAELTVSVGVELGHEGGHLLPAELLGELAQVLAADVTLLVPVQRREGKLRAGHYVRL